MPIVSIITPAYNVEKYISRTIDSVLLQDFKDWELIVIDDCSSDGTGQIVMDYEHRDPRVKYLKMEKNGGAVRARNKGIDNAEGRYIAFLDSDDIWFPEKLTMQLRHMEDNQYPFSYSEYIANYDGIKILRKPPAKLSYSILLRKNYIGCLTAIYDTHFFGKLHMPNYSKRHDWALWLQMLQRVDWIYGIAKPLAEYTIRKNSLSSQKVSLVKDNWLVFRFYEGQHLKAYLRFGYFLIINVWHTFREKGIFFVRRHEKKS